MTCSSAHIFCVWKSSVCHTIASLLLLLYFVCFSISGKFFSQKSGFRDTCFKLGGLFLAGQIAFLFSPHHCYNHKLVTLLMKGIRSRWFLLKEEISPSQTRHQGSEHHAKEHLFFSYSTFSTYHSSPWAEPYWLFRWWDHFWLVTNKWLEAFCWCHLHIAKVLWGDNDLQKEKKITIQRTKEHWFVIF